MKTFLKKYLAITIFIMILSFSSFVRAENTVSNQVENNITENSITTNTTNNTTTTKKSSNANLSTLGVTPKEYDFTGFKQNTTSYSVTIPNDVDSLKVSYKTVDKNAKVKVTGNTNLEVGTNTIKVVVTAEDGKTTKTYTIKVTKLATEDEKPGNLIDEEDSSELYLTSLSIKGLEITPKFSKDVYSYETTIDMDEEDLSKVTVEAKANDNNAEIEITGNTNLQEGENIINVIVKSKDSSEQIVYQITVNKISKASEIATTGFHINKEHIIIGSFITIVIIIFAIIIINNKKNKYDDYEEELEDEEDTYNFKNDSSSNNFIEDLYKRRNDGERLNKFEEETISDIEKENDRIFNKPKKGETIKYEEFDNSDIDEDRIDRKKGKHF